MDQVLSATILYLSQQLNKKLQPSELQLIKKRISSTSLDNISSIKIAVRDLLNEFLYRETANSNLAIYEKDPIQYYKNIIDTDNEHDSLYNNDISRFNSKYNINLSSSISSFLQKNYKMLYTLSNKLNPSSKLFYAYLLLDTNNLSEQPSDTSVAISSFKWNIQSGASSVLRKGNINLHSPLYRIAKMRMGRSVFSDIPLTLMNTLLTNRIVYNIEELNAHSFISPTSTRFHFIKQYSSRMGNMLTMSPFGSNRGWFRFNNNHAPITTLTLTITDILASLSPKISLPQVATSITAVQSYGTSVVTIFGNLANPLTIQTTDMALLHLFPNPGDSLTFTTYTKRSYTFSGFTTATPGASPDAETIALYNQNYALTCVDVNYFNSPVALPVGLSLGATINVTISWIYPPRITTALELLYELPEEEALL